jgi:N-methylhydantoinase A
MYAFGGAGPVHGGHVAELLRLPTLVSPMGAGVGSTFGLLAAPLAFDFVRSAYSLLDGLDWSFVNGMFDEMCAEGRSILEQSGLGPDDIVYERTADMRYTGQGHEVSVPIPDGVLDASHLGAIAGAFERTYEHMYGRTVPDVLVEVINWRVVARGPEQPLNFSTGSRQAAATRARKGTRPVYSAGRGEFVETPVYDRYALTPGMTFPGPAIVEERESTLVVTARSKARVDDYLNVVVEFDYDQHAA